MSERIRDIHCSARTEAAHVQWVRRAVRLHGLRQPADMQARELAAFLSWLASNRQVVAVTRLVGMFSAARCSPRQPHP